MVEASSAYQPKNQKIEKRDIQRLHGLLTQLAEFDFNAPSADYSKVIAELNQEKEMLEALGFGFADFAERYLRGHEQREIQNIRSLIDYYIENKSGRIPSHFLEEESNPSEYVNLPDLIREDDHENAWIRDYLLQKDAPEIKPVHKESLIGLAMVILEARKREIKVRADLYPTTTG